MGLLYLCFLQPPDGMTLLPLEKDLKIRFDTLNTEKQDRLNRLHSRSKVDQELCDAMCLTPYYVPSGSVPSEKQLLELEEHIKGLECEKVGVVYNSIYSN